jgi:putative redox protein
MEYKAMTIMTARYAGEKNCALVHELSGSEIQTDAPKDNHGRGEKFSPTDLLASSLLSCMMTTMAIKFEPTGINFEGCHGKVSKEMSGPPRRVQKLNIEIHLKRELTSEQKNQLEDAALQCPVKLSLHPETLVNCTSHYNL